MFLTDLDFATVNNRFDASINQLPEAVKHFIADLCKLLTNFPDIGTIWAKFKDLMSREKYIHFLYIILTKNKSLNLFDTIANVVKGSFDVFVYMSTKFNKIIFYEVRTQKHRCTQIHWKILLGYSVCVLL